MRFATALEHRDFFAKQKHIEFEDLFTADECALLRTKAEGILARRLLIPVPKLAHTGSLKLFGAGRNLWREDTEIKRLLFRPRFVEIASSLFRTTPLRVAYDQLIHTFSTAESPFSQDFSLQNISSFQPITGGLMIQLSNEVALPPHTEHFCPVPQKLGSGIFLSPDLVLSLETLFQLKNQTLLLVVFCPNKTRYVLQKNDPHTHGLKKEGYVFGDPLKSPIHPVIYP